MFSGVNCSILHCNVHPLTLLCFCVYFFIHCSFFVFQFVDKQDKEDGNQSSSVVPSFSIGKKKKEEDVAKRAEEAEEYYKKCVEEANVRQFEIEKTRVCDEIKKSN